MLERISIKNFKQIETQVDVTLNNINIIIGSNNAGKSTLMQAIQFMTSVCQSVEYLRNTTVSGEELIYTPIKDIYALAYNWVLTQTTGFQIGFFFSTNEEVVMDVFKGKNKNISIRFDNVTLLESSTVEGMLNNTTTPFSMYVPGLAGINPSEHYITPSIVRKAVAKGNANNYFRNILFQLSKEPDEWHLFMVHFQQFFADYTLSIEFNPIRDEFIEVSLNKEGSNKLPIDCAGAGMIQTIQILSYIHLYKPKILLLDEPDSHLHPNNQKLLMNVIESIAQNGVRVIVATHSRHIVDNALLMDNVNLIWAKEGSFEVVEQARIPIMKIFSDIGAIDGMDRLMLPDKKCLILTEDSDTKAIKAILQASSFNLEETVIWSYQSCTKIDTAMGVAYFACLNNPDIKIIAHRDRDYMTDGECLDFESKFSQAGITCFLTTGVDIESHFISADHIHNLFSEHLSIEECTRIITQAIINSETDSIEKFASSLQYNAGGRSLRLHDAMQSARTLYNTNHKRYCYGKKVIKELKQSLQSHTTLSSIRDDDIFRCSSAISSEFLTNIASTIWVSEN